MSKVLRKAAEGQSCTLGIFPWCVGWVNTDTTVLAHLNSNLSGMGLKSPDWCGVHACAVCHDIIDGRKKVDLTEAEILRCEKKALIATLGRLIAAGLINIKGGKN